jgi:hypothetical protein
MSRQHGNVVLKGGSVQCPAKMHCYQLERNSEQTLFCTEYVSTLSVQKLEADLPFGKHGDSDLPHLQSPKLLNEYRFFYKHYDSSIR